MPTLKLWCGPLADAERRLRDPREPGLPFREVTLAPTAAGSTPVPLSTRLASLGTACGGEKSKLLPGGSFQNSSKETEEERGGGKKNPPTVFLVVPGPRLAEVGDDESLLRDGDKVVLATRVDRQPPHAGKDGRGPGSSISSAKRGEGGCMRLVTGLVLTVALVAAAAAAGTATGHALHRYGWGAGPGERAPAVYPVDRWGTTDKDVAYVAALPRYEREGGEMRVMTRSVPPPGYHAQARTIERWTTAPGALQQVSRRIMVTLCDPDGPHDAWKVLDEQSGPLFWTVLRAVQGLRVSGYIRVTPELKYISTGDDSKSDDDEKSVPRLRALMDLSTLAENEFDPCGFNYSAGAIANECMGSGSGRDCSETDADALSNINSIVSSALRVVAKTKPGYFAWKSPPLLDIIRFSDFMDRSHDLLGSNVAVLGDDGLFTAVFAALHRSPAVTLLTDDPTASAIVRATTLSALRVDDAHYHARIVPLNENGSLPLSVVSTFDTVVLGAFGTSEDLSRLPQLMSGVASVGYFLASDVALGDVNKARLQRALVKMGLLLTDWRPGFFHFEDGSPAALVRVEAAAPPAGLAVGPDGSIDELPGMVLTGVKRPPARVRDASDGENGGKKRERKGFAGGVIVPGGGAAWISPDLSSYVSHNSASRIAALLAADTKNPDGDTSGTGGEEMEEGEEEEEEEEEGEEEAYEEDEEEEE